MMCLNCGKREWSKWNVFVVAKENENLANRICCSEKCLIEWWISRDDE